MSEKYTRIEGPDGKTLIVSKPIRLIDLLPSPKDAAREGTGISDRQSDAAWLYGESGKCPR